MRRRVADGSLEERRLPEIFKRFAGDREFWALIEITSEVLRTAEILVANHPLRTLDAIHVASAQLFAARTTVFELTFVSADTRQCAVAASLGLPTNDIGS